MDIGIEGRADQPTRLTKPQRLAFWGSFGGWAMDGFNWTVFGLVLAPTMVALLPLAGGIIADRILGVRKAVAFGCLLLVAGHLTMAMEGSPAQNILTTQGRTYAVKTEGRASARQVRLEVDGKPYAFKSQPDGALDIQGLPTGATLPAHLAKGDYQISVVGRDALHANLLFLALSLIVMGRET